MMTIKSVFMCLMYFFVFSLGQEKKITVSFVSSMVKEANASLQNAINAKQQIEKTFVKGGQELTKFGFQTAQAGIGAASTGTEVGTKVASTVINATGKMFKIGEGIGNQILPGNFASKITGIAGDAITAAGSGVTAMGELGSSVIKNEGGRFVNRTQIYVDETFKDKEGIVDKVNNFQKDMTKAVADSIEKQSN